MFRSDGVRDRITERERVDKLLASRSRDAVVERVATYGDVTYWVRVRLKAEVHVSVRVSV